MIKSIFTEDIVIDYNKNMYNICSFFVNLVTYLAIIANLFPSWHVYTHSSLNIQLYSSLKGNAWLGTWDLSRKLIDFRKCSVLVDIFRKELDDHIFTLTLYGGIWGRIVEYQVEYWLQFIDIYLSCKVGIYLSWKPILEREVLFFIFYDKYYKGKLLWTDLDF